MRERSGSSMGGVFEVRVVVSLVLTVTLITIGCATAAAQPKALAQQDQTPHLPPVTIGQECLKCHEEATRTFNFSSHGKSAQFLKGAEAATCDVCHGDGKKHVASGRPRDILTP